MKNKRLKVKMKKKVNGKNTKYNKYKKHTKEVSKLKTTNRTLE